jgi:hypothetical protein
MYRFKAKLWIWPGGTANWHFITVPKKESADIKSKIKLRRGFGSVKVEAQLGKTKWETSIFPDSRSGTYLLPVKAKVRREEGIDAGEEVAVVLKTEG